MAVNNLAGSVTAALLAGQAVDLNWGECSCGAHAVGSDAHYSDCAVGAVAETEHVIRLHTYPCGTHVKAICSCGWERFGATYPTRTAEGRRLAEQDGEMHLRDPQVPAFKPLGW